MKKKWLKKKNFIWVELILTFVFALNLAGCNGETTVEKDEKIHVVLEEAEGFRAETMAKEVEPGTDVSFVLELQEGYLLDGLNYQDYTTTYSQGNQVSVTLKEVQYPAVVTVQTRRSDLEICYDSNWGEATQVSLPVLDTHLRINTSTGVDLFQREGYTLIGWNTSPDGSGQQVGLGSRMELAKELADTLIKSQVLYAQWAKWNEPEDFQYEVQQDQVVLTGYTGNSDTLVIPQTIEGKTVISIKKGTFPELQAKTVVLSPTIQVVEEGAFEKATLEILYLYDNITYINDYSFAGCDNLTTLHMNAVEAPVYSGNYFSTFQDKYDRLLSIKDQPKIVLFSGSSTRFGYDSQRIQDAFSPYQVVNMGVFAYTNAAPQMMLILQCMQEGDVLLHSPEFDAAKRQFCTSWDLDEEFYCMMESNYDLIAQLDLRMFQKIFSAMYTYLDVKATLTPGTYSMTPADFDEDGNPVQEKSYNEYGDYSLYRPNSDTEDPIYGLAVDYTGAAFPKETYIDPVNHMYQRFLDKGVHVYFTYAPRNCYALSEESTIEARAQLDEYFRINLKVPVISSIEESLYTGTYLYGTDNHLSTQGVQIRTDKIIADLTSQMETEGLGHE